MKIYYIVSCFAVACTLELTHASPISNILEERTAASDANTKACPDYCAGTNINKSLIHNYVCGDNRLGPKRLPTRLPLDSLTELYERFGGLCPGQFLAKWFNTTSGYYNYPPDSGYQLDINNVPIEGTITLQVGFLLDRFGSEYGTFVSPAAAPYMQRALPPSNLDTPPNNPTYPYNYHIYRVVKPFNALTGPIAAWFGQPGQGVQYQLSTNIMDLISGEFLERVGLSAL